MATLVRMFYHSGLATAEVAAGTRYATDSVSMLKQPYLGRQKISAGASATLSAAAPSKTKLAFIQVEAGKAVHFEVNPNSDTARTADTDSPILTGQTQLEFGEGWTLSLMEATVS